MNIHWKRWCQSWSSNTLAYWWEEVTHWKRPWCWERLRAKGEGDDRGWDGRRASSTQWTWVWPNSTRWCKTQMPYMLQFMGSQRDRHDLATEQPPYRNNRNTAFLTTSIDCYCISRSPWVTEALWTTSSIEHYGLPVAVAQPSWIVPSDTHNSISSMLHMKKD